MSKKDRKYFEQRLEQAEESFKTMSESKKKANELSWALAELRDGHKLPNSPKKPDYQKVFDEKVNRLAQRYDEKNQPKKCYMPDGLFWWILFLTLPFAGACVAYFNDNSMDMMGLVEKILFIALCIVGPIPAIVFVVDICRIISYRPRVKHYLKRNRKRLAEIEKFKVDAEKEVKRAQGKYENDCEDYQREIEKYNEDEKKIERYTKRMEENRNAVSECESFLAQFFDEMDTPKEYRDEHHLGLIKLMFSVDSSVAPETSPADSFKHAYGVFREGDEEYEIAQLANRRMNREREAIRAERAEREAAKREKEEKERREKEEAEKLKRWKELDDWADVVNAQ